jgi:hypothetical protein
MGWAAVVKGVVSGLHGYLEGSVQKAQIEANNRLSAAFTDASNKVRGGQNAFAAARGALQRYVQSVNNNRTLDAGGTAMEANLVNARRQDDAVKESDFETQLRDAERTGAQAAAAAFAGMGGSDAADMVSLSTRLTQQRASAQATQYGDYRAFDTARRQGAIAHQMVGSLDNSLIFDQIDYTVNTATRNRAIDPGYMGLMAGVDSILGSGVLKNYGQNDKPQQQQSGQTFRFNAAQDSQAASVAYDDTNFGTGSDYGSQDMGGFI